MFINIVVLKNGSSLVVVMLLQLLGDEFAAF
jgi:hypothetical protein